MNERFSIFVMLLLLLVASLLATWIYFQIRARRLFGQDWKSILSKVTPIDRKNLTIVALDLLGDGDGLNGCEGSCELESSEILGLIGGLEALRAIERNCDAVIDLTCYCQRFYPEALVIAEELRINTREIKWHLDRLNAAVQNGTSPATFGEYAQRIATTYYLMTRGLFALYEAYNVPGIRKVQISLG
jgi:hypothetical protein